MDDLPLTLAPASGFLRQPEPKAIGNANRGRQILDGVLPVAGQLLQGDPFLVWDLPSEALTALHGFGWLEDLAAVGTPAARHMAQERVMSWIALNPDPVQETLEWSPDVTGRRLMHWLFSASAILPGLTRTQGQTFFTSLALHLGHLNACWHQADDGLPRLQALAGLALGALHLRDADHLIAPTLITLTDEAEAMGVETLGAARSPEAFLDAVALLVWVYEAAASARITIPPQLPALLDHFTQILRALRHADGSLPQFHGGSQGAPGRLDHCLRAAPGPAVTAPGLALGFARMARGRTTLILDAAPPPSGDAAANGHASTLGFELTVARQPLIVSCGPGFSFGPIWYRASRSTPCHSALCLAGLSSSRLGLKDGSAQSPDLLLERPESVWAGDYDGQGRLIEPSLGSARSGQAAHLLSGHDGWLSSHGLTHLRELWLEPDGKVLDGEDSLAALDEAAEARLAEIIGTPDGPSGIGFDIRFHLHPAVTPHLLDQQVRLALPGGNEWVFSHDGRAELRIEPSCWLVPGNAQPMPSRQIVLTAVLTGRAIQIGWTLAQSDVR